MASSESLQSQYVVFWVVKGQPISPIQSLCSGYMVNLVGWVQPAYSLYFEFLDDGSMLTSLAKKMGKMFSLCERGECIS